MLKRRVAGSEAEKECLTSPHACEVALGQIGRVYKRQRIREVAAQLSDCFGVVEVLQCAEALDNGTS